MTPQTPNLLERRLRVCAGVLLAAGIVAIYFAGKIGTDNRMERWISPHGDIAREYAHFREQFGSDQFILVAVSGKPLFDAAALDALVESQRRVEALPEVRRVSGIPAVYRDVFGGENPEDLRREITSTPFYRRLFISADERVAGIMLDADIPSDASDRSSLIDRIESAYEPAKAYGFRVDLVGPPVLNVALDKISGKEALRCFPPALAGAVIVLLLLLRSARGTLVCVLCSGWSVVLTVGLMGAFHRSFNMVTSVLPPLLWVLSLSYNLHLLSQFERRRRELPLAQAIRCARDETWMPILFSGLTTAIGFLSLAFSDMAPVREKGIFSATGIMISVAVSLTIGPLLIAWFRVPELKSRNVWRHSFLTAASNASISRPWIVTLIFVIVIIASCGSLFFISAEGNPLSFLPPSAPMVQSYQFVGTNLTGLSSLELVVRTPSAWTDTKYWPGIESLVARLAKIPAVSRVVSPLDFLKKANQWDHGVDAAEYRLPDSAKDAIRLLDGMSDAARAELRHFVSQDGKELRISVLVNQMESSVFLNVAREARAGLAVLPEGMSGYTTGIVQQLVESQRRLVATQIESFGFTFLLVFVCIWIGVRSWRLMLVSVLPGVMPILSAFACMACLAIPLDAATVMVANVALGIAADNIIHLLAVYARQRKAGAGADDAVRQAVGVVGPAITVASLTTCIGFFALCRSMFVPIRYFGALTGVALMVGLAADLVFAPAILVLWGRSLDKRSQMKGP